jgi:tRNA A-37 threonylcarbamoyl transferase component Bud32
LLAGFPEKNSSGSITQLDTSVQHTHAFEVADRLRYLGDYELLEEIARGGMGVVYKARQVSLDRVVALKMILAGHLASQSEVARFLAEAEAAARLQHPQIVAIHEVGRAGEQHFYSMDYVDGPDLARLVTDKPLRASQAAELLERIARAVAYAHDQGVLHRDLKPQNILIDSHGQPRITDFGLARRMDQDSKLTASGTVLGSPAYMPPEQAAGQLDRLGPASDVYALGAVLYHLLTGRPPLQGKTLADTLAMIATEPPLQPSQLVATVPGDLETICLKCLEKDPRRRYASALELADDLARFRDHQPIQARPASTLRRAWEWAGRRPWAICSALSLLLLSVLGLAYGLYQQTQYLAYVAAHPAYVRAPGPMVEALNPWLMPGSLLFALLGVLLCDAGIRYYGQTWRQFLNEGLDQRRSRQPLPAGMLAIYGIAGAIGLLYSGWVCLQLIDAFVWEAASPWRGLLGTGQAFPTAWFGAIMLSIAITGSRERAVGLDERRVPVQQIHIAQGGQAVTDMGWLVGSSLVQFAVAAVVVWYGPIDRLALALELLAGWCMGAGMVVNSRIRALGWRMLAAFGCITPLLIRLMVIERSLSDSPPWWFVAVFAGVLTVARSVRVPEQGQVEHA